MAVYPFVVGEAYTKNDIYRICNVPVAKQKGNWNTGYTQYDGDWFIFCGVGVPGRTGHDYGNHFVGEDLVWYGKTRSHLGQDSIRSMIASDARVYVFHRSVDRAPFTFGGLARAKSYEDVIPVQIVWTFPKPAVAFASPSTDFLPVIIGVRVTIRFPDLVI